jgi:AcrR family transcriptional regulator
LQNGLLSKETINQGSTPVARPDISNLRQRQILDAFVSCVAEYGLQGATQQRIAEKAGVKRPILRHYLGNKGDMVDSLADHVAARYQEQIHWLRDALPSEHRVEGLLELLFLADDSTDYELGIAFQALAVHCSASPKKQVLRRCTDEFTDLLSQELRQQFPLAPETRIEQVTLALASLSIAQESLAPLGDASDSGKRAHDAALTLLHLLKGDPT